MARDGAFFVARRTLGLGAAFFVTFLGGAGRALFLAAALAAALLAPLRASAPRVRFAVGLGDFLATLDLAAGFLIPVRRVAGARFVTRAALRLAITPCPFLPPGPTGPGPDLP